MKNGLLTAGVLVAGLVVFAGTMTMAGAALRIPPKDVVVSVKTAEKTEKLSPVSFPYSVEGEKQRQNQREGKHIPPSSV